MELNEMQEEAVRTFDTPLLVSAGAGSGKTRVITCKIASLIRDRNIPPGRILGVTFTNKAAEEMTARIRVLLEESLPGLWLGTFHSFCSRLLKIETEEPFIIIDENDKKSVLMEIIRDLSLDPEIYGPYAVSSIISRLKNRLIPPDRREAFLESEELKGIFTLYGAYEDYKKKCSYYDFDDLLINALRLLGNRRETLEKYREKFSCILADEFQDTNTLQYELIRFLGHGKSSITVVGDPDQSIYSWRGADPSNFQRFLRDFPGCRVIKLEQNYRSHNIILEAATSVIRHNSSYDGKKLWSAKDGGERIKVFSAPFISDESAFVAEHIRELAGNGRAFRDMAVFCRTNYYYENLEFALREAQIPYRIIGGVKFFDRLEIRNIIAYLKFLNNFNDDLSLIRILNTPGRGIGARSVEKLKQSARKEQKPLVRILDRAGKAIFTKARQKTIKEFIALMKELAGEQKGRRPDAFLELLLDRIGYDAYLEKFPESDLRRNNVRELVRDAAAFGARFPKAATADYLDRISLFSEIDALDEKEDRVNIITIHNAKGLEFPVVFMIGLFNGQFPHYRVLTGEDPARGIEEERRLFYVGLTRARELIYLTGCQTQTGYDGRSARVTRPSQFLSEIPEKYIEYLVP